MPFVKHTKDIFVNMVTDVMGACIMSLLTSYLLRVVERLCSELGGI